MMEVEEAKTFRLSRSSQRRATNSNPSHGQLVQNYSASRIDTNGGPVGSYNQYHAGDNVFSNCNVKIFQVIDLPTRGTKMQSGQCARAACGGDYYPGSIERGDESLQCDPELSASQMDDRDSWVLVDPHQDSLTTFEGKQIAHDCNNRRSRDVGSPTSATNGRTTPHIMNIIERTTRRPQFCKPHTTLILHLDDLLRRKQVDLSCLQRTIQKHLPHPPSFKLSRSRSTLFCYPSTSYTDAHLTQLKDVIWGRIYLLLGVPVTHSWRMKLFSSWPSVVVHNVPVGGPSDQVAPSGLQERMLSDLIQHNGITGLQVDDIKEMRCLSKGGTVPVEGKVSMKLSFGRQEDARHFLEHGAFVFGARYKTSSYVPRKFHWRRSG